MKSTLFFFTAFFISATSFAAANSIECKSEKQNYIITVTPDQIFISVSKPKIKTTVWNRSDAGLYSYFADSAEGVFEGNERSITQVRLDLEHSKKIEQLPRGAQFSFDLSFSDYNITLDYSRMISEDHGTCTRITKQ